MPSEAPQGEGTPPSPSPRSRKTRRKERYQLGERIGAGGMGTVYRALDRELNRTVAVKILRPDVASNLASLLRLKRELVLASRVSDDHVVRVYDIGEAAGQTLIAMDWVDGESLARLLARVHRLPPSQVCDFATQICGALRSIHAARIVHRDLKPGNLLLNRTGEILVSDFGLARSVSPQDVSLSAVGESGGTPRYMAPEQLAGLPADPRSDLYSLGIVLLEMLTGATALESLEPLRQQWIAAPGEKHVRSGELRKLAALDLAIRRCLQLDRTERYATAGEVLRDLALAHRETAADVLPVPQSSVWRSGRLYAAIAAGAVLLMVSGILGLHEESSGRPPGSVSSAQLYAKALGLMAPNSSEPDLRSAAQTLDEALAQTPKYLPALRARLEVSIRLFEATADPHRLVEAREELRRSAAAGLDQPQHALYEARIDLHAGRYAEVIRNLRSDAPLLASSAEAHRLLGRALEASGRLPEALSSYRAAVRLNPESWIAHNDLASGLRASGNLAEASRQFREVTRLNPESAAGYSNLGVALLEAGELEGAQQNFEMALERQAAPETYLDLGLTTYYSRRYASAIPFFQSAIQLRPQSDQYVVALADALWHSGNQDAARQAYSQALSLLDRREQTRRLDTEERCRRALCFAHLRDFNSAHSALNAAAGADPRDQTLLYTSAVVAALEGRPAAARQQLANALRAGYPAGLAKVDPDLKDLF